MNQDNKKEMKSDLLYYLNNEENIPNKDNYLGAILFSAIGDALGWPTEFLNIKRKKSIELPLTDFVRWRKLVGGKWWGYNDDILPGEYSDDTQLTLSVARCINNIGGFDTNAFAFEELPLWLHYQRGGGSSLKAAARSIIRGKNEWKNNFYKAGNVEYQNAGANGAAMRNLPIALVNINNENRLILDSFKNAIITHGHPRAIIGTILYGISLRYVLTSGYYKDINMIDYLVKSLKHTHLIINKDKNIQGWINKWNSYYKMDYDFNIVYNKILEETFTYMNMIPKYITRPSIDYYNAVGALSPETKGSGVGTTCCSIYMFLKYIENPDNAIYEAVNIIGSDTDTIAAFIGALLGANYGRSVIPLSLEKQIQDREYLEKIAYRLYNISTQNMDDKISENKIINKKEALLKILAWEIGLHDMFWDAIGEGCNIVHPIFGKGLIIKKDVVTIPRQNYIAKLLYVKFDCGQSCLFHSRVEKNGNVSESIAKEAEKVFFKYFM